MAYLAQTLAGDLVVTREGSFKRVQEAYESITISVSYSITTYEKQLSSFVAAGGNNTVNLPDATTLALGWQQEIFNDPSSTVNLNVYNNGGILLQTIAAGSAFIFTAIGVSTSNGVWSYAFQVPSNTSITLIGSTSGSITINAPSTITNYSVTFPASQGAANTTLINNGSGILTWTLIPTGSGSATDVAYWSGTSTLTGTSNFTFSSGTLNLSTTNNVNLVSASAIQVGSTSQSASTAGAGSIQYTAGVLQYSNGTIWSTLSSSASDWSINGNTLSADSSIGSLNAYSLVFITNSMEVGRFTNTGNFHLGSTSFYTEYILIATFTTQNNQVSPVVIFTYPTSQAVSYFIKYNLTRAGNVQCGMLVLCQNGSTGSIADYGSTEADTGITFDVVISGGNLELTYTSDNSGGTGVMNYQICRF